MNCAWQELINILPTWLRNYVDEYGKNNMTELRLRLGQAPELVLLQSRKFLERHISEEDLRYIVNTATRYSPWTSYTLKEGFITSAGGHRIGLCGEYGYQEGELKNISVITSMCIRVARNIANVSGDVWKKKGSILIIGSPGAGKTTFLRDLIMHISDYQTCTVAVVDERREIFPVWGGKYIFHPGKRTDVLSGCRKEKGLEIALRTLGPSVIAMDEITNAEDCTALIHAAWCGVRLIATAHAGSRDELYARSVYKPLIEKKLFDTLIVLDRDKKWYQEVMRS